MWSWLPWCKRRQGRKWAPPQAYPVPFGASGEPTMYCLQGSANPGYVSTEDTKSSYGNRWDTGAREKKHSEGKNSSRFNNGSGGGHGGEAKGDSVALYGRARSHSTIRTLLFSNLISDCYFLFHPFCNSSSFLLRPLSLNMCWLSDGPLGGLFP